MWIATGMRYAKMKADQMAEEMAGALQAIFAASRERAASMKGTVTSSITGRNAVIQGVNAGEKGSSFPCGWHSGTHLSGPAMRSRLRSTAAPCRPSAAESVGAQKR